MPIQTRRSNYPPPFSQLYFIKCRFWKGISLEREGKGGGGGVIYVVRIGIESAGGNPVGVRSKLGICIICVG